MNPFQARLVNQENVRMEGKEATVAGQRLGSSLAESGPPPPAVAAVTAADELEAVAAYTGAGSGKKWHTKLPRAASHVRSSVTKGSNSDPVEGKIVFKINFSFKYLWNPIATYIRLIFFTDFCQTQGDLNSRFFLNSSKFHN